MVNEDDLEQGREKSSYDSDTQVRLRPQYRDIHKFWKNCEVRLAYIGMENETEPENDMPMRVIGYDGAAYRDQIQYKKENDKRQKNTERYPVITLVLYLGYQHRWNKAKSIHEALGDSLSEELKPYVNDYKINLFEIAYLEPEDVALFKSDFRILADYLVQMRKNNHYKPSSMQIHHIREVLNAMTALTNDNRFIEIYEKAENREEMTNMCKVMDEAINLGIERGIEQGIERGIEQGMKKERIRNLAEMLSNGGTEDQLRQFLKASDDEIKSAKESLLQPV